MNPTAHAYAKFHPKDLIIRDLLALDRTVLANERTFLSYIRTALGLAASGGVLIKVSPDNPYLFALGCALLPIALLTFTYGYRRFLQVRKALLSIHDVPSH